MHHRRGFHGHSSAVWGRAPDLVDSLIGLRVGSTLTTADAKALSRRPALNRFTPNERRRHVANIKSQIKRNKAVKSELKTAVRRTREAITAGDKAAAEKALGTATKKLDKAVSKGIIHQNQAANRKSAIAKQVAAL